MIQACFFDCFGVLYVNARVAYFSQFPELYNELHDLNQQADFGLISRQDYVTAVSRLTGVSEEETLTAFSKEHTINQPLIEFIKRDLRPHYKIGLLTNLGKGWIQDFFDQHQLHELFDAVVVSSEEGITKPNPIIYERAAERLHLPTSACLMIDDHEDNCEGARAAGMKAIHFTDLPRFQRMMTELKEKE